MQGLSDMASQGSQTPHVVAGIPPKEPCRKWGGCWEFLTTEPQELKKVTCPAYR